MVKLLLDANQSPETRKFLSKKFGFDEVDLISENKTHLSDEQVVSQPKKDKRIIVTFDLDFGEIYYFKEKGRLGVIILRLEDQTVESVIRRLERFFTKEGANLNLKKKLIVLTEDKVRIV